MSFTTRIIDTSSTELGKVIRINITDDGIFRVFYNDIDGNMYCALSRESNYKQVIFKSAQNRTTIDVSNIELNGFNEPLYGGTYSINEVSNNLINVTGPFYIFQYSVNDPPVEQTSTDRGPWRYFTELKFENFISQGSTANNPSIYDKNGYSSILANGQNSAFHTPRTPHFYNQVAQGWGVTATPGINADLINIGVPIPDTLDLRGQTLTDIITNNRPLNDALYNDLQLFEPTWRNTSIDTNYMSLAGGPATNSGLRENNYYAAYASSKFVWLDASNNATSNTNGAIGSTDNYYKGRWLIWVDISGSSSTSGNIYIARTNNSFDFPFFYSIIDNFNDSSTTSNIDISSIHVDIDVDISKNSTINNGNFNNIYAKPFFVASSDLSNNIVVGNVPYDVSYNTVNDINYIQIPVKSNSIGAKYCKIKIDHTSNNWDTTNWHLVYYDIVANKPVYARGENSNTPTEHYNLQDLDWMPSFSFEPCGLFLDMAIDSLGLPHVVFYSRQRQVDTFGNVSFSNGITYLKAINNPPTSTSDWEASFVDDTMASNEPGYTDLSNNHPISIKLDKDDKAHIVYQAQNSSGDFDIRYWTNSTKLIDISEIDSSLNYVGFHTEGANIDDVSGNIEVYWDISACNCIFSRDFNRKDISGITTSQLKCKNFYYPLGARPGNDAAWSPLVLSGQDSWRQGLYYNHAALDKIYAVADIVTPTSPNSFNNLICLGGTANQGSIKFGIDCVTPGVSFVYMLGDNGQSLLLTAKPSETNAILYKDGVLASGLPVTQFALQNGTAYRLKYYFNKSNYYGSIRVERLNGSDNSEGLYEFYDISQNGGFIIGDGYLSLLTDNHDSAITPSTTPLYLSAVSIYATDISNVPTFDLSRNGGILTEVTGTPFSSYSDFSGVELEPTVMKYQIVNAKNDLNNFFSNGGKSKIKESILHDIYYYERINTQNDQNLQTYSKNFVNAFDKFTNLVNGYYEIWAAGYESFGSAGPDNIQKLWRSVDGGQNWNIVESYPTGVSGEQILDIKTHIDTNGGRWVFVCGENYLIRVTNDYNGNTPNGRQLGTVWKTIGDLQGSGNGDPSGNYYNFFNSLNLNIRSLDFNTISIVEINTAQSSAIFPSLPSPDSATFHVWIGTNKYFETIPPQPIVLGTSVIVDNIRIVNPTGAWDSEKYWFLINSSGQTVLSARDSSTAATNATEYGGTDVGAAAPYDDYHGVPADTYTLRLYDNYGDGWHGASIYVYDMCGNTLTSGTITSGYGPVNLSFTVTSSMVTVTVPPEISYPYGLPGYKDMLLRGNYVDYSNNQLDYSYNIVTNVIVDTSSNPTKSINESFNSFSFGGEYLDSGTNNTEGFNYGIVTTDSYIYQTKDGGLNWDKRLEIDRSKMAGPGGPYRGTTGSYVDKNIKISTGQYDNSGMYIQTSTEPWNEVPGFTVAYNDGDYNLAFTPLDSTVKKTTTWSPELGDYQDFWNIDTIDNSGSIVKYRKGGGNNLKVYIDSQSSNGTDYQKKQKMYTYDSLIPGYKKTESSIYYDTKSVLYSRDSELKNFWQRIEPSIVDPSLNGYFTNPKLKSAYEWDSFSDYDCSYSIINLPFANRQSSEVYNSAGDLNNYAGFYKLSKTPFTPYIKATQPQSDLFSANLTVQYRGGNSTGILNPTQFSSRLDFEKLNITSYFYFRKKSGAASPYGNWTLTDPPHKKDYTKNIIELEPGSTYQFKVRLLNNHGFGWFSNDSDEIIIPAPSPELDDLSISSKIFENVVSWTPYREPVDNQNSLQTIFSYNIEKQYVDDTGVWATDISFTNFYRDLSGTLGSSYGDLSGTKWTGPFNPVTQLKDLSDVSFCSFVDTDLSLNGIYRYIITAFPSNLNTTSSNTFTISKQTSSGKPTHIKHQYTPNDASFNILWTIDSDISSNTDVTWDISWQEIRKDSPQYDNSGIVQLTDPYIGQEGVGKLREVNIPLFNNHLQADASYNFQIKVDYSNNTIVTDYAPSSSNVQIPLYSGGQPYDPSGIKTYYNYQQPPVLNGATYNTTTDLLDISWTSVNIPTTPFYYDVSMSNVTVNRTDVSYNFIVYNGTTLVDPSNNGKNIYPGSYVVRVRAAYGDSVPVDISLFSEWSSPLTLANDVPQHLPSNLILTPYNFSNVPGNFTDVSFVQISWDSVSNDDYSIPGFPIPETYTLIRKTASKDYNYVIDFVKNNIPRTSNSYNDTNYPLGHFNPTVPRIYRYDLSANYL